MPGQAVYKDTTGLTPISDVTRWSVAVHRRLSHILIDDLGAIDLTEHLTDRDVAIDGRQGA